MTGLSRQYWLCDDDGDDNDSDDDGHDDDGHDYDGHDDGDDERQ